MVTRQGGMARARRCAAAARERARSRRPAQCAQRARVPGPPVECRQDRSARAVRALRVPRARASHGAGERTSRPPLRQRFERIVYEGDAVLFSQALHAMAEAAELAERSQGARDPPWPPSGSAPAKRAHSVVLLPDESEFSGQSNSSAPPRASHAEPCRVTRPHSSSPSGCRRRRFARPDREGASTSTAVRHDSAPARRRRQRCATLPRRKPAFEIAVEMIRGHVEHRRGDGAQTAKSSPAGNSKARARRHRATAPAS